MQTQVSKKLWIFFATIIILSIIGLTISNWGTPDNPLALLAGLLSAAIAVFFFPAISAVLLLFLTKTMGKAVIAFKNLVTKKEPLRFKNIFPHSVSLPGVIILTIFFYGLIVCTSLNSSTRVKGPVAAIKSNMGNMRAQGELYFVANNSSYGVQKLASRDTCLTEGTMFMEKSIMQGFLSIESNNSYKKGSMVCAIGQSGKSWAVSTRFLEDRAQNICLPPLTAVKDFFVTPKESPWCVDSSGRMGPYPGIETHNDGSVGCATT